MAAVALKGLNSSARDDANFRHRIAWRQRHSARFARASVTAFPAAQNRLPFFYTFMTSAARRSSIN